MEDGIASSSATIRHDMKALEEYGLLAKTHSSSGRIPQWLVIVTTWIIFTTNTSRRERT